MQVISKRVLTNIDSMDELDQTLVNAKLVRSVAAKSSFDALSVLSLIEEKMKQ